MTSSNTVLLIDGDMIAYQACCSCEYEVRWDNDIHTLHSSAPEVKEIILSRIDYLMEKLNGDQFVIALSDSKNFRKDVYPEYKSNRKDKRKPLVLSYIRKWLVETQGATIWDSVEADDILGVLSTTLTDDTTKAIIVSIDKDFNTVPGWIFNSKQDPEPYYVTEEEANLNFFKQALSGDTTDGYPGCPGVGPTIAHRILRDMDGLDVEACWELIVSTYEKKGKLSEDFALQMARCARILRKGEYSNKEGVKLWSPYTPG